MVGWSIPIVVGSTAVSIVSAAEASRPRGVGPEFAKFYKDTTGFSCIANPSIKLSVAQINDDYCDCPDGSDEPGTAACAHLSKLSPHPPGSVPDAGGLTYNLTLPGFYCKNKGHRPSYVPFGYINDGVCDYELCCDGSDEWAQVGGTKCEDRCKSIGKEWKKQNEARVKSQGAALKRKAELVAEASKLRLEIEKWLEDSEIQLKAAEMKAANLEKEKLELERKERGKVVKSAGATGKVGVLAGLTKTRLEQVSGALDTLRTQRNALQDQVTELESILSTFKTDYNPNFNDEGVKRAVRSWEEYAAREKPSGVHDGFETDLEDLVKAAEVIPWNEFADTEDETELDLLYAFEAYLPGPVREWVDQKLRNLRVLLIENGVLPEPTNPDGGESEAVRTAREQHQSAINEVSDIQRQQREHRESLETDYGKDDAFRSIKGQCVSLDSGEYTYELCWMASVTQISKKGGSRNGMGNFVRFETTHVDEEVKADGKGLGSGERVVMKYENGAHCWQGPNRSTTVVLACAEKEEIWKVMEEEKCVYRIEAGTPAVCDSPTNNGAGAAAGGKAKDEL